MIENLIRALIASLDANTAAHGGTVPADSTGAGEATAAATTTTTAGKAKPAAAAGKAKPAAPKGPAREEVVALLTRLKDEQGAAAAKALVTSPGGAVKMADIPDANLKAVFDAATAALAGEDGAGDGDDDGL